MFQGSGAVFTPLGFEYWANPANRDEGFITWQVNGKPSVRMGAGAMGPDQGPDGSQVGQRIVPEEPMSIILNLGISRTYPPFWPSAKGRVLTTCLSLENWQQIDLSTMVFPAIMQVDYVRIYQRSGHTNIGCDPADYPTAKYIEDHAEAYSSMFSPRCSFRPRMMLTGASQILTSRTGHNHHQSVQDTHGPKTLW